MTPRAVASLSCRILALYTWVMAIFWIPTLLFMVEPLVSDRAFTTLEMVRGLASGLIPVIQVAAGAFLWRWSALIAAWMVGHDIQDAVDEPEVRREAARPREVHAIAFSVVGLWILVQAIPDAVNFVGGLLFAQDGGPSNPYFHSTSRQAPATFAGLVIRGALGVWLLFGARALVDLVHRARRIGLDRDDAADPE